MFHINGRIEERTVTRYSPIFVIHVPGDNIDLMNLQVIRRHYDSPAAQILKLNDSAWERLKREAQRLDRMTCLGPTFHEFANGYKDRNWTVRATRLDSQGDGLGAQIYPEEPSTLILDLGVPVDEDLHCGKDAVLKDAQSIDEWQDIFPTQLKRRIAED
jgi:hypothetical protein